MAVTGASRKQAGLYYDKGGAVFNVMHPDFGAKCDGVTDDTAAIAAALVAGAGKTILFPAGAAHYKITDELLPDNNTKLMFEPGVILRQYTANKYAIKVVQKDSVYLDGFATIYCEGSWSAAWNDFASHNDRGVGFLGCTNSGMSNIRVRNAAMCGVAILGGNNIKVKSLVVEGTHALGHPLTPGVSLYQFGVVVMHDLTYGSCNNIEVEGEIFNTAMGVNTVDNTTPGTSFGSIILRLYCHDIIGQHGAYIGTSFTTLPAYKAKNCGLMGIKIFSGSQNEQIRDSNCIGFNITDCGGEATQLGVSGTGYLLNCHFQGYARNVTRLHTSDGDLRLCSVIVRGLDITQRALYVAKSLTANGPTDCMWDIDAYNCAEKGALISAAGSDRNTLRFKGRRCSVGGGGHWMVGANNCSGLIIEKLDCSDDLGNMTYGFFAEVNALGVKLTGTPNIQGYTTNAFRSDVVSSPVRWECSGMDVTSEKTAFFGQGNNFLPVTKMRLGRQTTVNANVPLWQMTAKDESSYNVRVVINGKLSGSAERRTTTLIGSFWRDAAGVLTQQGATTVLNNDASGGFAGTCSFSPTVNDIRVICNSAGAATYDWLIDVEECLEVQP